MTVKEPMLISSKEQTKPWIETPLKESYALSEAAGCRIFLKLENLQPSGSFKSRGLGNYLLHALQTLPDPSAPAHVYCSSGGNAGLGAVHAARTFNLPCTVCVPMSTKPMMIAKLKAAGAYEVIQHGATWGVADAYLRKEVMANAGTPNVIYAPPFDHPDVWSGNSTIMDELTLQMPNGEPPSTIICSVGGGGLFNGICQGLDRYGWTESTTVVAVETEGADALNKSVEAREMVKLDKITSQATSLGAPHVTQRSLDYALRPTVKSVVLPDAEAAMGCWRLADDERIMVELACGVNVALCYDGRLERVLGRKVLPDEKIVIVLCGGSGVTADLLSQWRAEYAWLEKGLKNGNGDVPSAYSAPNVNGH